MTRRVALYFAPEPGSALEAFGRRWLGRDHVTGAHVEQPRIDGLDADELRRMTGSARHYGFHATLKAPFALMDGQSSDAFHDAVEAFARKRAPFDAPPLLLSRLSRWIAFTLAAPCPSMDRLAADCVTSFEAFRAPLSEEDVQRRRQQGLTERQGAQLLAFGYPYIFEDFHFHMTLAGPLDQEEQSRILDVLGELSPPLEGSPLKVGALAVYEQADRSQPFIQTARFPFQG